jgi:hypothetical protein
MKSQGNKKLSRKIEWKITKCGIVIMKVKSAFFDLSKDIHHDETNYRTI